MKQAKRRKTEPEEIENLPHPELMILQAGYKGPVDILLRLKDMTVDPVQEIEGLPLGVNINCGAHNRIEPAHLIESKGVVNMVMGEENCITTLEGMIKSLGAKVRRGINQDDSFLSLSIGKFQTDAGPAAAVTRIIGGADIALAGNDGHT